ncbi:hydroxymethylbilane synthase [Myxococcota bacterium]|nr:hydroxymethylbilane synthase [Myxococcota bacterium]
MPHPMLKIGTRGSALALWQAETIRALLSPHAPCEIHIVHTSGDKDQQTSLTQLRAPGFFTKELERALHAGHVDLAVHSLKDVPTQDPEGLELIGIMRRGDPRDTLLINPEAWIEGAEGLPLKPGARVGTGSNRRRAQLRRLRPDLELLDLRGNVPTRLDKLRRGDYDAILAAEAGLQRLEIDRAGLISLPLDVSGFVPAPGQAAVAVQMRIGDPHTALVREAMHDQLTAQAIQAERGLMRRLEGGCQLPLGVHARPEGEGWRLWVSSAPAPAPGALPDPSGEALDLRGDDPAALADQAFKALRPLDGRQLVITRAESAPLAAALRALGAQVYLRPALEIVFQDVMIDAAGVDWVFFSSANGLRGLKRLLSLPSTARYAVVGPRTGRALAAEGLKPEVQAAGGCAAGLVDDFLALNLPPQRVLWPVGDLADAAAAARLEAAGHTVRREIVYHTRAPAQIEGLEGLARPELIFYSPSAFHHLRAVGIPEGARLISIGATTSQAIREAGFEVACQAKAPTTASLIEALTL